MKRFSIIMLIICLADLIITIAGLHFGWFVGEANPIIGCSLKQWGYTGLIVHKTLLNFLSIFIICAIFKLVSQKELKPYHTIFLFGNKNKTIICKEDVKMYQRIVIISYITILVAGISFQIIDWI